MRLRITALLLTFAGAANCLRMAAKRRPHKTKSRIVRVTGGKSSVLYSDGARQWTIDGSRLKHFELDDLRKRDFDNFRPQASSSTRMAPAPGTWAARRRSSAS